MYTVGAGALSQQNSRNAVNAPKITAADSQSGGSLRIVALPLKLLRAEPSGLLGLVALIAIVNVGGLL